MYFFSSCLCRNLVKVQLGMMWGSFVLKMTAVFKHRPPLPPYTPWGLSVFSGFFSPVFLCLPSDAYASDF